MIKYKTGDKIKVIATLEDLRRICIYPEDDIKGKIGVVEAIYLSGGSLTAKFDDGELWSLPSNYVHKVVE